MRSAPALVLPSLILQELAQACISGGVLPSEQGPLPQLGCCCTCWSQHSGSARLRDIDLDAGLLLRASGAKLPPLLSPIPAEGAQNHSRRRERTWVPHWVHCCPGAAAPTVLSRPPTRRRRLAAFSALALLARAPRRLPPHALPSAHAHHAADASLVCHSSQSNAQESDWRWAPQMPQASQADLISPRSRCMAKSPVPVLRQELKSRRPHHRRGSSLRARRRARARARSWASAARCARWTAARSPARPAGPAPPAGAPPPPPVAFQHQFGLHRFTSVFSKDATDSACTGHHHGCSAAGSSSRHPYSVLQRLAYDPNSICKLDSNPQLNLKQDQTESALCSCCAGKSTHDTGLEVPPGLVAPAQAKSRGPQSP